MNATEISRKTNLRMNRIQKVSRWIRLFLLYGIPLIVIGFLASAAFVSQSWLTNQMHNTPEGVEVTRLTKIAQDHPTASGLSSIFRLVLYLFWYRTALKLFGHFERGVLFTAETVRCIQILGGIYITGFLIELIFCFFMPVSVALSAGLSDLIAGLLLIFIGWLLDEARKIREEQELTV